MSTCFCMLAHDSWKNHNEIESEKARGEKKTKWTVLNVFENTYIRRVGDQFTKENFFVRVEGVDDQWHQLSNFSLESESLDFIFFWHLEIGARQRKKNQLVVLFMENVWNLRKNCCKLYLSVGRQHRGFDIFYSEMHILCFIIILNNSQQQFG